MKIEFLLECTCYTLNSGGFDGYSVGGSVKMKPGIYEVVKVKPEEVKGYFTIVAEDDGCCDGDRYELVNVPGSWFKILS